MLKNIYKKVLLLVVVGGLVVGVPSGVNALTGSELAQKILAIQEQIKQLQVLLAAMLAHEPMVEGAYAAVDLSSGTMLASHNSTQEFPIASTTKLMNAVVATEHLDMDKKVTLTQEMLSPYGYSPSLFLGASVAAGDLLHASLIQSTNDAANSLAAMVGNDEFVKLMNQKAGELGMANTHYEDAHGLGLGNRSTAQDLAKLLAYVYKNHPELLAITKDNHFLLPDPTGRMLTFKNVNNFSLHPDFVGGKTGYLPEARQSMVSVFTINGKPVAIAVLFTKDRQKDILNIIDFLKTAK